MSSNKKNAGIAKDQNTSNKGGRRRNRRGKKRVAQQAQAKPATETKAAAPKAKQNRRRNRRNKARTQLVPVQHMDTSGITYNVIEGPSAAIGNFLKAKGNQIRVLAGGFHETLVKPTLIAVYVDGHVFSKTDAIPTDFITGLIPSEFITAHVIFRATGGLKGAKLAGNIGVDRFHKQLRAFFAAFMGRLNKKDNQQLLIGNGEDETTVFWTQGAKIVALPPQIFGDAQTRMTINADHFAIGERGGKEVYYATPIDMIRFVRYGINPNWTIATIPAGIKHLAFAKNGATRLLVRMDDEETPITAFTVEIKDGEIVLTDVENEAFGLNELFKNGVLYGQYPRGTYWLSDGKLTRKAHKALTPEQKSLFVRGAKPAIETDEVVTSAN